MTPADRLRALERKEGTAKALAAWIDVGAKLPKPDYRAAWKKKTVPKTRKLL